VKLKLNIDDLTDGFFEDTRLIGIVAPIKDYQLVWQLNKRLRFDFRTSHELEIQLTRKQRQYFFCIYEYQEPGNALGHFLYNNQFEGEYLLPEFKHLDFLWLQKGDTVSDDSITDLMSSVRSVPGIQLVMELAQEKIKNKGHLIF
jgi:hypothetical protein